MSTANEEDSLDSYMKSLKEPQLEKQTISRLKSELIKLKQDYAQVTKLLNLAKPAEMPALQSQTSSAQSDVGNKNKLLPVFGKKKKIKVEKPAATIVKPETVENDEGEELEDEDEDNENKNKVAKSENISVSSSISEKQKSGDDPEISNIENKVVVDELSVVNKTEIEIKKSVSKPSGTPRKKENEQQFRSEKKPNDKMKKNVSKPYPKDGYSEDYSMWVPPSNQSGDGRTSLNDKLGY